MNVHNSIFLVYAKFNGLSYMVPGYRFWGGLSLYSVSCTSLTKKTCNTKAVFNHFDRDLYNTYIYNIVGTNHHTLYRPEQQGWMYYAEPNWVDTSKIQVSEAIIKHPYFDCLYMLFTIHFMKKKGCCTIVLRTLYPLFEWSINWPLIIDHSWLYSNHWWTIKLTIESLSTILRLQNLQDGAPQLCLLLYKPH